MKNPTALIIITDGIEELEAVAPVDCLRRAGAQVTVASAGTRTVTGRNDIKITADVLLDEAGDDYDLIVVPGGPSHSAMMEDSRILQLLRGQNEAKKLIGSICAGPIVLNAAGVLEGKRFTSFPSTSEKLPQRDPGREVVRDGHLITSQGAGTAIPFAITLVEALFDEEKGRAIAESICFRH